ncbi:MAG: hypothetical protein DWP97_06520 [Calditrichaeota bacterium]|nr:MAG: hypothetical protein DWP97_06520 [Calditrichota bacterium]
MSAYRAYLHEEKDIAFDFQSAFSHDATLPELFSELSRRLETAYDIDKGVLAVRNANDDGFQAVATWENGEVLEGLKLSLPTDPSLFEQVAMDSRVYTDTYGGIFSGNFFEKKLLFNDDSKSYLLHPIKFEGKVIGILGYSSQTESAFTLMEEGSLVKVIDDLGKFINLKKMNNLIF